MIKFYDKTRKRLVFVEGIAYRDYCDGLRDSVEGTTISAAWSMLPGPHARALVPTAHAQSDEFPFVTARGLA